MRGLDAYLTTEPDPHADCPGGPCPECGACWWCETACECVPRGGEGEADV